MADERKVDYALSDTENEKKRLREQSKIIIETTRRVFALAGVEPGMRVLELGTGAASEIRTQWRSGRVPGGRFHRAPRGDPAYAAYAENVGSIIRRHGEIGDGDADGIQAAAGFQKSGAAGADDAHGRFYRGAGLGWDRLVRQHDKEPRADDREARHRDGGRGGRRYAEGQDYRGVFYVGRPRRGRHVEHVDQRVGAEGMNLNLIEIGYFRCYTLNGI